MAVQGLLLFEDAESGEENLDFYGVFSKDLANGTTQLTAEVQGCMSNGTQRMGCFAGAGSTVVLAEGGVEHIEAAVFDTPASAAIRSAGSWDPRSCGRGW